MNEKGKDNEIKITNDLILRKANKIYLELLYFTINDIKKREQCYYNFFSSSIIENKEKNKKVENKENENNKINDINNCDKSSEENSFEDSSDMSCEEEI